MRYRRAFHGLRVEPDARKLISIAGRSCAQGIGTVSGPAGSVSISPAATTTYTLSASNGAGLAGSIVTVGVDETEASPQISEFLASHAGGLKDRNGARPDWTEIYNPNLFTLNLRDFYLTDSASKKTKWKFPSFPVPAQGYAIVFADHSGISPDLDTPHTNFSLSADGEDVGLIAKNGSTVLSQIPAGGGTYPRQSADHSYGVENGVPGFFSRRPRTLRTAPPTRGSCRTSISAAAGDSTPGRSRRTPPASGGPLFLRLRAGD